MHPHVLDPELDALPHRALGLVRRGGDDDGFDASGDASQVVVTAGTLNRLGIRVDREDLVAAVAQTLEHGIGAMIPGLSRNARHGNALVSEEFGIGFLHRRHLPPPLRFSSSASWRYSSRQLQQSLRSPGCLRFGLARCGADRLDVLAREPSFGFEERVGPGHLAALRVVARRGQQDPLFRRRIFRPLREVDRLSPLRHFVRHEPGQGRNLRIPGRPHGCVGVTVTARAIEHGCEPLCRLVRLNRAGAVSRRIRGRGTHELSGGKDDDKNNGGLRESSSHHASSRSPELRQAQLAVTGNPADGAGWSSHPGWTRSYARRPTGRHMACRQFPANNTPPPWRFSEKRSAMWLGARPSSGGYFAIATNYFAVAMSRKRADIHEAFHSPGCALICWRALRKAWATA